MKNLIIVILLLFFSKSLHSQMLPDSDLMFKKFTAYTKVGNNMLGKQIKKAEANTTFYVFSQGINTYFSFETTLINGGEQDFKVLNIEKKQQGNKLLSFIETYNVKDPAITKQILKFIFEYTEGVLTKVTLLTTEGAIEFY